MRYSILKIGRGSKAMQRQQCSSYRQQCLWCSVHQVHALNTTGDCSMYVFSSLA